MAMNSRGQQKTGALPEKPIALITGANRGIGRQIALQLAEKGVTVILGARQVSNLQELQSLMQKRGFMAHSLSLDVAEPDSINHTTRLIESNFGRLDILINNAGIYLDQGISISQLDPDCMQRSLDVNVMGPYRLCVAMLPLMHKHNCGRIVNVSSGMGESSSLTPDSGSYRFSKFALNALTRMLAADNPGPGIQINAVCPGWVRTDMGGQSAPRNASEGARGIVEVALRESGAASGKFFRDGKEIPW